ncbi:MAG: hypothetical protein Q7T03_06460 [Deltaproteobacteria bacterium]|nr:hypothetical protein [Deltaproteobacteria bacterium]
MLKKSGAWKKAEEFGIDTSLLEFNLSKTYTERALAHQKAVEFAEALQKAGANYYRKWPAKKTKK